MVFVPPPGGNPAQIWVQFLNASDSITGTYVDPQGATQTLAANTAYSLAELTGPASVGGGAPANVPAVMVSSFGSGRVYVSYGTSGLAGLGSGYIPDPASNADPNYLTRYQYFEPDIASQQINVDLTYIDFFSISLNFRAVNAPNAQNNAQTSGPSLDLAAAAAGSASPAGASVVPDASSVLPSPNFARVLGPQVGGTFYHDWSNYLASFLPGNSVTLSGLFDGVGTQPSGTPITQQQTYLFTGAFAPNGDITLTAQTGSGNGMATFIPPANQGPGIGDNVTITITAAALSAVTGIYGNNPSYTYTIDANPFGPTSGIENNVIGEVVGDLVAGLSFGMVGSTANFNGTPVGDLDSTAWWGGTLADGTAVAPASSPAGQNFVFGKVQSTPLNYHTYAAAILPFTSAYGFPLQDRVGQNLLAFNTGTDPSAYLEVKIDPSVAPPTARPRIKISGRKTRRVSSARITVRGRVLGPTPVATVEFRSLRPPRWRDATLRNNGRKWLAKNVRLKQGRNVIRARATSTAGTRSKVERVRIIRR